MGWVLWAVLVTSALGQTTTAGRRMADTVLAKWPRGRMPTLNSPGKWTYEEGVLLDGMTAEWRATGDASYLQYVKETIDGHLVTLRCRS